MIYFVYILKSLKDGKRYIGSTSTLDIRIFEHINGGVKATKNRRPLQLIYTEEFPTKSEAQGRERYFKTGAGRAFLNRISK
ncbi:MAG: GIY-YIG nuclease family protein [bacterium]|nr:GIY-YIG nuclease family protein [bacterium]MDD5354167.1 GIY-YIG nuclease family protein [bacterium]MDD5756985.1 GIY-YIG nuclease family protein [bacterium]